MENGFGTSDILTGRGLGLGGFGGYNYGAPYADLASNAVRINRNEGVTRDAQKCTTDTLTANLARISDQAEEGRRSAQFTALVDSGTNAEFRTLDRLRDIRDGQFQGELRTNDRLRDLERIMIDGQRDADKCCCDLKIEMLKCCCETQKLVSAEGTATRELINQNTIRAAIDQNNINATIGAINANANANTNAIVNAITSVCGK